MTEHIVHRFDDELSQLHSQVMAMASLVVEQTQAALGHAVSGIPVDAADFVDKEKTINEHDLAIDGAAVSLIARRGPLALDLRTVMAMSKMTTDLERIGDEAATLNELTTQWSGSGGLLGECLGESDWASQLLQRTVTVLETFDVVQAEEIESSQAKLVEPFRTTIAQLAALEQQENAGDAVLRALAVRCIERIGEHACNLCEHVVYLGRGVDVRHQ